MWLVYLILISDAVTTAATVFAVFAGLGWLVTFILSCVATAQQNSSCPDFDKDDQKAIDKIKKVCLSIFIPCLFVALFIPNSKQLAIAYTAGNAIEYVQGNEKIKELPDKAVKCLDKFIDEYLNEKNE